MANLDLRGLPASQRTLAAAFLITLGLAYAVALLFVFVKSEMTTAGISRQFRGGEAPAAAAGDPESDEDAIPGLREEWSARRSGMQFPKSLKEMILTTHLHMLSIGMILFLVGGIFSFSSFPERAKPAVIAAGFCALALAYLGMWGVRYLGGGFSALVFMGGLAQALSLGLQMLWSLRDLTLHRGKYQKASASRP